jgi:hypothetical protein
MTSCILPGATPVGSAEDSLSPGCRAVRLGVRTVGSCVGPTRARQTLGDRSRAEHGDTAGQSLEHGQPNPHPAPVTEAPRRPRDNNASIRCHSALLSQQSCFLIKASRDSKPGITTRFALESLLSMT